MTNEKEINNKLFEEELETKISDLFKIKGVLYSEGINKFEKSLNIINGFIKFLEELKLGHKEIEEFSEEEAAINQILNSIDRFIENIKKEMGLN